MLKNKIIFKRIRNICILVMAVAILVGTYTYVRRSRAENVIQIELEVSDKSETLEAQKIIVDATETQDGNYILNLPTSVNGNIVTKYYMADGSEVAMNDENANKTLTLTETDITNQPIQLQTDYDKKDVTTEDGQTITLYNKELMDVKDTEEDVNVENPEGANTEAQANETQTSETTNETTNETQITDQKTELDDTVIVTGYMPLESQVDIYKMDVSTMNVQLPSDTQTIQDAYEVSVYQTIRKTVDAEGNVTSEEVVMPENKTENAENDTTKENTTPENETTNTQENETSGNETTTTQENTIIEDINSENAKENENVESVTETTTPDNTTITTILLKDGTRIEEEKIEYDPSLYNEQLTIKTKNTEENTIATIYELQDDNQVIPLESTTEEDYVDTTIQKDSQVVRYVLATEPMPQNEVAPNSLDSDSGISTVADDTGDYNYLIQEYTSIDPTSFLWNDAVQREYVENVTFLDSFEGMNDTAWDVSAAQDGSIMAWYEYVTDKTYRVYIGSNEEIYANPNSTNLFARLAQDDCTYPEIVTNIELLNTSQVTNMSYMFANVGGQFGWRDAELHLDLGTNFDTSKVTNMSDMFKNASVSSLNLGNKFDTSQVTNMQNMFSGVGDDYFTYLNLENKFDVSKVTNMSMMFYNTGYNTLKTLDLGPMFTKISTNNTNMFARSDTTNFTLIVPKEIYSDRTHLKLEESSSTTISIPTATIKTFNYLKKDTGGSSGTPFLGNENIRRDKVDNVTFVDSLSGANSTAWDVSEAQDGSIKAWYTVNSNKTYKIYIGSDEAIFANPDSSDLFAYIGLGGSWSTSTEIITNMDLLYTSDVINMSDMFVMVGNFFTKPIQLDLGDNFDTSNVTNMSNMFSSVGNSSTELDLGDKFYTRNVTDMSYMFNSSGKPHLGSHFDTSNVTNMEGMFSRTGAAVITSLDLGDKFDTSKVTNMNRMFNETGRDTMTNLNLGSAFTHIAENNTDMFTNTGKSGNVISVPEEIYVDEHHVRLNETSSKQIEYTKGTFKVIGPNYLRTTSSETSQSSGFLGNTSIQRQNIENVTFVSGISEANNTAWDVSEKQDGSIMAWYETSNSNGALKVYIGSNETIYANIDSSYLFSDIGYSSNCTATEVITHIDFLDTSNVTNMSYMFYNTGYRAMTSLNLGENFDTSNVTNMNYMFYITGDNAMTSLDLGDKFDTSNVTTMKSMFNSTGYTAMTSLDLGDKFDTSNVTDMNSMFLGTGNNAMTSLDLGDKFDTSNVTKMNMMFYSTGYTAMTSLDLGDKFDTSNVTDMNAMFQETGYTAMTSLDLGDKFDTSNVTDMESMFDSTGYTAMTSLDLGENFDTSNVTNMSYMFYRTGYTAMTSLDLGDKFDTSNVTTMKSMFNSTGYTAMTSLDLGDKFDTSNVTDMNSMFERTGYSVMTSLDLGDKFDTSKVTDMYTMFRRTGNGAMTSLDLGPAFTNIASTNTNMFTNTGKSGCVIQAPETIYNNRTNFKLNTSSSTTISYTTGTINPKYRTEWVKESVSVDTTDANNPKLKITLRGTTNPEAGTDYISDVTSTLTADDIKVCIDSEVEAESITKTLGTATTATNPTTGAQDVIYELILSDFEESTIDESKGYKEWSGNITIDIAQGTLSDTIGNANMGITPDGERSDNRIEDETKVDKNTPNSMFMDYIKPTIIYQYQTTDIDYDGKAFTMVFDITDKYYDISSQLSLEDLTIRIDGEEPDWTEVNKSLQVEEKTVRINGENVTIGNTYTLTLSNLEQLQRKDGDNYLDYSGVVTVAIPANKILDKSGNGNNATTITSGISLPGGTGTEEVVDVVQPLVEKVTSTVNIVKEGTAELTFRVTDKYLQNSTLTTSNIQILVNGSVNTSVEKQLTSTALTEQRVENGTTSTVQYGTEYTLKLSGIDKTGVNQVKVRIPEGVITDTSGNGNEQTDLLLFNTLRSANGENEWYSIFLGNRSIDRENVDNVTFVDNIPSSVYDFSAKAYVDSTAWDVSAMQDNSIIAWYESSANDTVKVYIGSNDEIFGNVDSSYLFSYIGYSENCTSTEKITNIDLLNTSNVTNMNSMFNRTGWRAMTSLDLGENFDTSNVTDMSYMFYDTGNRAMTSLNLGEKFDTSSVTNMSHMFFNTGDTAMTSLDLGDKFDTSSVTNMSNMFCDTGYTAMIRLDLGDKFDTSNVTDMNNMFSATGREAMTSLDLGDKFDTSKVTDMSFMFHYTGYRAMTSLDLGDNFDTSNVTDMNGMFASTGYTAMTSLDLGDKFDTRNVTGMMEMFDSTGYTAMTSLDLGDKFDTENVTDMRHMFQYTGYTAMTSLDLGPAFTHITSERDYIFLRTGKQGEIIIQAPEAIYQDSTHLKLNTNPNTMIEFTNGTISPKYRTEWIKEGTQVDETEANNPKLKITLRGTTNTEVNPDEYISDVTGSLTTNDIKVFVDGTDVTDIITKSIGAATQTNNTRTGAKDVLQVLTLSNFEEVTRRTGKSYKEWSGNICVEVAQGTLTDTTYGNKNMGLAEDGAREDNKIEDETKLDKNTPNSMFMDYIKPEFTYTYSSTDINHEEKTLTVEFSVTDKYFNTSIGLTNADGITVKMLDTNAVPENITNTITKVEDINETRNGTSVKIGEKYRLVVSGFEQASIENGKYKEYSGPVSIAFPAGIASDKSGNTNTSKTITVGINEPDQTGEAEIVDVVSPMWEAKNLVVDEANNKVTVDLYGTDKYYKNNTLDVSKIKVIIDGEEVTSTTNVIKQLSAPTVLNETRDGATVSYGVKYTLTLANFVENDEQFEASGRPFREYSGETQLQIASGILIDTSGNESVETTLDLGMIDSIGPEFFKVSSNVDKENKKETIVFDVVDKYFATAQISTTDTSKIHVFVDDEEATSVTKIITNIEDLTEMIDGTNRVIGKRYTLELTNFEQARSATVDYNREYSDWSGDASIKIDAGTARDDLGNSSKEATIEGDFVDFVKPNATYQFSETDIDHDGKTYTMVFDMTDKFYDSGTLTLDDLTILIDGEEPDWTKVDKALQEEDRTNIINGETEVIGKRYTLTLSNLEQLQVKEGDNYLDYSGVITVAIPADKIIDTSGNANNATTLTSGLNLPGGTGDGEVVDVVQPLVEKITSSVDAANGTATLTFKATDKYFANSTLTNENLQITVDGQEVDSTDVTKEVTNEPLTEQRQVDGTTTEVQYGVQFNVKLSGLDTSVSQIKIRIPAGVITDQSGNGNEQTDLIIFNTLKATNTETESDSAFLGNTNIQRQNVDNVTFVDNIPEDVYDVINHTYIDATAWDVSAMQDNSIIAWYEESANETIKVYIGSNDEIFGNVDSSYLFNYIGSSSDCTATETITNINLLNTSNVTNMNHMFYRTGHTVMTSLDLGDKFDTSNVTDMSNMFSATGYTAMTSLDLGDKFDTSNVTDMSNMFSSTGYKAMTSLELGDKFDTSNVSDMSGMFRYTGYTAMTSLELGDKFDTSNVSDMSGMFRYTGYTAMTSLDLGDKFDTSSVTNMDGMFSYTGYTAMTSLDLGDKFDTSSVTNMNGMFSCTGYTAMTSLDLKDKFDTSNVTDMAGMFVETGHTAMTSLDLGPAFTNIAELNIGLMLCDTGKSGEIVIQAPEAIYNDRTHLKLNTDSTTTIGWQVYNAEEDDYEEATTYGTIHPKYRTEWLKEGTSIDETDTNNPKINITLRGTTNQEVAPTEYISDVTSSLTVDDIRVFIDNTEITDVVTKTIETATTTANTRTGAQDVLQVLTLSNFEEATRQVGKAYKEWSGNIRVEVAQGTLSDTTGPADEDGSRTTYGNSNMEVASSETQTGATTGAGAVTEIGARIDNIIQDETKVNQNTEGAMFADFIKPEFTYIYSATDINYDEKTLTVEFSVIDKYFNSSTVLANQDNITVKMLDTNVVPENITKTLTKVEDISETRDGQDIIIGETYQLVISGFEQASIAEDGKYKEYSGPVSIIFPTGIATDKSGNTNNQKNITIGIDEPDGTGDAEIVDVVAPIWEAKNVKIDKEKQEVTVELYGTDKYYAENTLDVSKIKVIIDGEEITSTTNVTKQLSTPTELTENRDGTTVPYGVKYILTLSNWKESDEDFGASEKPYREYSGNTQIQIDAGTLVDESGNENLETTLDLGMIDIIKPEIYQISSTKNETNKTDTIIFEAVDKHFKSSKITDTDTSGLTVYVDDEEAIGVTKTIVKIEDIKATINGSERKIGERYTLVISDFEQERTTPVDYDREYSDWSGNVTVKVAPGLIEDDSGNTNQDIGSEEDKELIDKETEYLGYYADIDGNGSVDGVIYADLAHGKSGQWGETYTKEYSYATETGLKDYYISKKSYAGDFGTKDVITALEGSVGKDRFYVMALEDVNDGNGPYYTWYDAAYDDGGQMDDYATATSKDFGSGKTNTATMIAKWNASDYGPQGDNVTYKDMWGVIQSEVAEGWFVPSMSEWVAFGDNLDITKNNYINHNLSDRCWSSSQSNADTAWRANVNSGFMSSSGVNYTNSVRLSATF